MMRAPLTKFEHLSRSKRYWHFHFFNSPHRGKLFFNPEKDGLDIEYELDDDAIKASQALDRFQKANGGEIIPPSVQITGTN